MANAVKGRPRKANKNVRFSCTLTPEQLEWVNMKAEEEGKERSAVLRDCVDKVMLENYKKVYYGQKNMLP